MRINLLCCCHVRQDHRCCCHVKQKHHFDTLIVVSKQWMLLHCIRAVLPEETHMTEVMLVMTVNLWDGKERLSDDKVSSFYMFASFSLKSPSIMMMSCLRKSLSICVILVMYSEGVIKWLLMITSGECILIWFFSYYRHVGEITSYQSAMRLPDYADRQEHILWDFLFVFRDSSFFFMSNVYFEECHLNLVPKNSRDWIELNTFPETKLHVVV